MSDNTPTQRFDAPVPPESEVVQEEKKNRGLMIALIVIGAVILIAIIILLIVLLGGKGKPVAVDTTTPTASASDTPSPTPTASSASPTPTPTPTPTHTTAPPPPPSGPTLTTFNATQPSTGNLTVKCDNRTGNPIPLSFRWAGTGGTHVYIAVGATSDPKQNGQGWDLPNPGTQADFPFPINYGCYQASQTFSLGIYDDAGHKSVKQVTIKNTGDLNG